MFRSYISNRYCINGISLLTSTPQHEIVMKKIIMFTLVAGALTFTSGRMLAQDSTTQQGEKLEKAGAMKEKRGENLEKRGARKERRGERLEKKGAREAKVGEAVEKKGEATGDKVL